MQVTVTELEGLLLLTPTVHRDERGFFLESYNEKVFADIGIICRFVQDNHARSEQADVMRGLHFQLPPYTQAKLVWVTRGAVFDVAVDLRTNSPTYGKSFSCRLDAENCQRLFVPRGFAHGYMTLEPGTEFQYKVDNVYSPSHDSGILWNDPALGIEWPGLDPVLSAKDKILPRLADFNSPFTL